MQGLRLGSKNTALRAINSLVESGLIHREPVPGRSHNYFVSRDLCRIIEEAKVRYAGRVKDSSPTRSEYEHPCSDNEPPGVQNMNPKEYTVKGSTENEYTVNKEARKKKIRAPEEAHASSSLPPPVDDYDDRVTLLEAADHMHALTPRERRNSTGRRLSCRSPASPTRRKASGRGGYSECATSGSSGTGEGEDTGECDLILKLYSDITSVK